MKKGMKGGRKKGSQGWWLIPVIPVGQEVEIWRIKI
jgi:hypothetical protein